MSQPWFREHTFHHAQFSDLARLVAEKQRQGLTISLCIPTLNEEKTIAKEILLFKSELMTRFPLLDEIAVIDSGSTDQTLAIAAQYGAATYHSAAILPQYGEKKGKGENLWKAIYQLRGDIIVYVDADIKNVRPHFVYGLVGPLICHPEMKYIKAFYDRPLVSPQGVTRPSGGGRVTEILVRPLFALFFPELCGLIQPLSGEYAVRREVLERIPFPIGYGVETSHLIDVYRQWGMGAFGQTDLDQRVHRNQSTRDLGKMAFAILRTFFSRLRSLGIVPEMPALGEVLKQFQAVGTSYEEVVWSLSNEERPPMREIPEYRQKRAGG